MAIDDPQLRVGAHVLVQLGRELVTDAEQAILECVKNSYDADSPGCFISIDTRESAVRIEAGHAGRLRPFGHDSETVAVEFKTPKGEKIDPSSPIPSDQLINRHLSYRGRISIEDAGDGLTPDQLRSSWLVVSQSEKRNETGEQKRKTKSGRTPLGDKGLGRLGSMKLGDILLIETATSSDKPVASAQFRWTDCEFARTVDEIPVYLTEEPNKQKFKGTRVSVLGLRDISDWQRKDRILDITSSLAKLISPFEATSVFPVKVSLDDDEQSLVAITDELLKQAIAQFTFEWRSDGLEPVLIATAQFKKRLFTSRRTNRHEDRTRVVFEQDDGAAFAKFLPGYKRLRGYDAPRIDVGGAWFIELQQSFGLAELVPDSGGAVEDPGSFEGAFYFFHFDKVEENNDGAAAGYPIDRKLVKSMSGISILRDGFRVRSQGDWLDLSSGMTSGSTYGMRVDNTVGYFALSGESNYRLTEKSDREGFVEDAAYRGFSAIARQCRNFANDALESVRRALDDYARDLTALDATGQSRTTEGSIRAVENNFRSAEEARDAADKVSAALQLEISKIQADEQAGGRVTNRALKVASNAIKAMELVRTKLRVNVHAEKDFLRLRQELEDRNERALFLLESAAVGLSARGLAHELRTHLTEIRQRVSALEKGARRKDVDTGSVLANLRAIRSSCNAIVSAAALIDPMLPRTRAVKELIDLRLLFETYFKTREIALAKVGVHVSLKGAARSVRANRSRLIQVVDNLVRNSTYWLKRSDGALAQQISVEFTKDGFVISDTGPGVDPKYEESLFEMFVTAKPDRDSGQGLGLFITKQLLQIDGCDIELLSKRNTNGRRYKFAVNLSSLVKA